MKIGNREFQREGHTYVMGILNVTPDSFSDGGKWNDRDRALGHVEEMLAEGADIIDIGGESTRPGYTPLPAEEEIARVAPVIEAVKGAFDVPISIDTYKAQVAKAGIMAGADLINDIWGLKYGSKTSKLSIGGSTAGMACGMQEEKCEGNMAAVIAENGLPCCLMHNREDMAYQSFLEDVCADLEESIDLALKAGIAPEKLILDPGVGFAKSYEQNLEIIRGLEKLKKLGYPLLLGCSRKSVIGLTLDLPSDQRLEGTLVTTVWAVVSGCMFVRVHDVKENVRAIKMTEAILNRR